MHRADLVRVNYSEWVSRLSHPLRLGDGQLLRWYCAIQAFFYLANAAAYWYALDRLSKAPSFRVIEDLVGLGWLVPVMAVMGVLFLGAVVRPNLVLIRALLTVSVGVKMLFGLSLLASNWSPGGFSYLALAATDLLVASAPLAPPGRYVPSAPVHDSRADEA